MRDPDQLKKGSETELEITDVAFGGKGIARAGETNLIVFVEGALPGDRVRARITRRKPQYAEATATALLSPGPDRTTAPCSVFGICGGCKWQDLAYPAQLRAKQRHVEDALRHIGRQQHEFEVRPIIGSPDEWNYRNKMEFSFGRAEFTDLPPRKSSDAAQLPSSDVTAISSDPSDPLDPSDPQNAAPATHPPITIGFHKSGDFRRIVQVDRCWIQPDLLNEVLHFTRDALNAAAPAEGSHFAPYDPKRHTGFLRHLVFRYSATTGHFLLVLITASGTWRGVTEFADALLARFPMCAGFIWGTNDGLSDVARIEHIRLERGECALTETLADKTFRLSAFSFFQTNTRGARVLYDVVRDFAELTGAETVLDAYCGTGTIGIYCADRARRVIGIELVKEAVWDARHNAKRNNAENCTFLAGEMRDVLPTIPNILGNATTFDRVIVDPPRGGMDKKSLRLLLELRAPLIVYVSCNPATLARDSLQLAEAGYLPELVQPVDMFPHTYHVESVIKFRLKP